MTHFFKSIFERTNDPSSGGGREAFPLGAHKHAGTQVFVLNQTEVYVLLEWP